MMIVDSFKYDYTKEIKNFMTAITIEDFSVYRPNKIKCRIPLIMPDIPDGDPKKSTTRLSVSNVKNREPIQKSQITECNYIELNIPQDIAFYCPRDKEGIVKKGQRFIAICLDGELDKIRIIGQDY